MTRKKDPEERVEDLLADAFASKRELFPTTEAEVRRAEEEELEHEGELPPSLQSWKPPKATKVVTLAAEKRRRSAWVTHGLAALLGAAAAAAVLFLARRPPVQSGGTVPTSEPRPPKADAAPAEERVALPAVATCAAGCCAGERCSAAKAELSSCSSGRKCIACSSEELAASRYRIRLGSFAPTAAGAKAVVAAGGGGLELCVRVGSSEPACVPAHANSDRTEQWSLLPTVASAQDLLAGFVLQVRAKAQPGKAIAEWQSPVQVNPTVLCRGLSLRPKTAKDEALGVVSVFLEDAHYVELGRAGTVALLLALKSRVAPSDVPAKLFETRGLADQKFSLVLGPVDKPTADRLRWAALERGLEARLTIGEDHVGEPKPLE